MQDFETVLQIILAQLYENFPVAISIDRDSICRMLAESGGCDTTLPSGVPAHEMISEVVLWLRDEGFTHNRSAGSPEGSVVLSSRGLAAMGVRAPGSRTWASHVRALGSRGWAPHIRAPRWKAWTRGRLVNAVWQGAIDWARYGRFVHRLHRTTSTVLLLAGYATLVAVIVMSWVKLGWPAGKPDLGASQRLLAAVAATVSGLLLLHIVPGLRGAGRYALVALALAVVAALLAIRWAYRGFSVFLEAQAGLWP